MKPSPLFTGTAGVPPRNERRRREKGFWFLELSTQKKPSDRLV